MESRSLDEETPQPTLSWKESCKKAIIPEVSVYISVTVYLLTQ